MPTELAEPVSTTNIYVNPNNNLVHLMLPVLSGRRIGLDNTCKSVLSLQGFFGKSSKQQQLTALEELVSYQQALEFDLSLIPGESPLKELKTYRLKQINEYIVAITALQNHHALNTLNGAYPVYPVPIQQLMQTEQSNLYSMHLRPTSQDTHLRSSNPVFSLDRSNDGSGNPNSKFYTTLLERYQTVTIVPKDARARLIAGTLASDGFLGNDLLVMQQVLQITTLEQLGEDIAFTQSITGEPVSIEFIKNSMLFDDTATSADYIAALLALCAPRLFEMVTELPFDTANTAEELSIVTQFFLGVTNIYCVSHGISKANFGRVLDSSVDLSQALVECVISAHSSVLSIEDALLAFVNSRLVEFELTQTLLQKDTSLIKTIFKECYTEIKGSPHFDEFSVLQANKPGLFVTYHGSICTGLAELVKLPYSSYFQQIRDDYKQLQGVIVDGIIPHKNEHIAASVEFDFESLSDVQLDDLFKKLPSKSRLEMFKTMPALQFRMQLRDVLNYVARGEQDEVELILQNNSEVAQRLMLTAGVFIDYSGRRFNCNAYVYAYWCKDIHMLRMFEVHMNPTTKAAMREYINAIMQDGLTYIQHGHEVEHSKHFDMTPLKAALQNYDVRYNAWIKSANYDAMKTAWMMVGLAQRDLPVHVINEMFRPDRDFRLLPEFNEDDLPRVLTYYNSVTHSKARLFPLVLSASDGLGVSFALSRLNELDDACGRSWLLGKCSLDLLALSRLDEVRTTDLTHSREILGCDYDHGATP